MTVKELRLKCEELERSGWGELIVLATDGDEEYTIGLTVCADEGKLWLDGTAQDGELN